jgi:hypothetical protein
LPLQLPLPNINSSSLSQWLQMCSFLSTPFPPASSWPPLASPGELVAVFQVMSGTCFCGSDAQVTHQAESSRFVRFVHTACLVKWLC